MAALAGQQSEDFCRSVIGATQERIVMALVEHASRKSGGGMLTRFMKGHSQSDLLSVSVTLKVPLIGIGAASRLLLPGVAQTLGTTVYFPDQYEVGNAMGAILLAADARTRA